MNNVLCSLCNDTGYVDGKKCHQCWIQGVSVSKDYVAKKLGFDSAEQMDAWNEARHIQPPQNEDRELH